MKLFLLKFLCSVVALIDCSKIDAADEIQVDKLKVEVYYEALCPDSMRFVRNQLYPTMMTMDLLKYTDLDFIPYGKVGSWTDPETNITNLYCQHGNRECELNALHACIVEHNTIEQQMKMFNCLLSGYYTDENKCASDLEIDISAAKNCKETHSTVELLRKHGDKTDAIEISFVPSIGIGGTFDPWKQRSILYNFPSTFCSKYKEKFNTTLDKCKEENII